MGNCLKSGSSSTVWAKDDDGDEWEWVSPDNLIPERNHLLGDNKHYKNDTSSSSSSFSFSSSSSSGELKIIISKKQLEQLLAGKGEDMNMVELLVDAGNRDGSEMLRQRSWRPRLQSIPEVN